MPAGPEHDHLTPPDKPGLRAAWLGSRRVAVLAGVIAVGVLAGAGVAVAATSSPSPTPTPTASPPAPSARPPLRALLPKGAWRIHDVRENDQTEQPPAPSLRETLRNELKSPKSGAGPR